MRYFSTRNSKTANLASEAILQGIAEDGGLFVDPQIRTRKVDLKSLLPCNYEQLANAILPIFLPDYSASDIEACVKHAYGSSFEHPDITPIVKVGTDYVLELFHGPTAAFKDVALSILPHFLTTAKEHLKDEREVIILTATSGDTGKAALAGFQDIPNTKIIVFYPKYGVSTIQEWQMITSKGNNVIVVGIEGDFDDAQRGVKEIFAKQLSNQKVQLSSANSINIGRLIPQVIYYFHSYLTLCRNHEITMHDLVNFAVPTGNFGNILAAYYAKLLGLPIHKLICASNQNHVLYDFIKTGQYNRNHSLHKTISPSMDILVSSNLERFLFELSDHDYSYISQLMNQLQSTGQYQVTDHLHNKIQDVLYPFYSNDEATKTAIRECFLSHQYLMDPHTAIAYQAAKDYQLQAESKIPTVIVSTASPFKFASDVYKALFGEGEHNDPFELMELLAFKTNTKIPASLAHLKDNQILHRDVIPADQMEIFVRTLLEERR